MPEPVPVVVYDIVPESLHARRGALPQIPVQPPGDRNLPADADRRAVVHIPRFGVAHPADLAGADRRNGLDHVGPRTALVAHLHHTVVFQGRADQQFVFRRVMARRLLEIDMLAGLHGHDGRGGMPVVGHGDHHGIDILRLEQTAQIPLAAGFAPADLGDILAAFGQSARIDIAHTGYLAVPHLRKTLSQGIAARIHADHADPDALVGSGGPCRHHAGQDASQGYGSRPRHQFLNEVSSRSHRS